MIASERGRSVLCAAKQSIKQSNVPLTIMLFKKCRIVRLAAVFHESNARSREQCVELIWRCVSAGVIDTESCSFVSLGASSPSAIVEFKSA